jgi:3-dehydroquinate synthase
MKTSVEFEADEVRYRAVYGRLSASDVAEFHQAASGLFIISDSNVWSAHGEKFSGLGAAMIVPAGEASKSVERWSEIQSWLAKSGADRRSAILAVGGGMITDLAGFCAATYMRGIAYSSVATSLMAQVDAALGGKTGIDLPEGKNLVGAFHHPSRVWCDPQVLQTVPEAEFKNGMAEVIKYGFAVDASIVNLLESRRAEIANRDEDAMLDLTSRCGSLKAQVVREDPKETIGRRAVLNFGHTVGHAIEAESGYQLYRHGEAVCLGMIVEAMVGELMKLTPAGSCTRVIKTARQWGLPTALRSGLNAERLIERMRRDKKAVAGSLTMSLIGEVGTCLLTPGVPEPIVIEALKVIAA